MLIKRTNGKEKYLLYKIFTIKRIGKQSTRQFQIGTFVLGK